MADPDAPSSRARSTVALVAALLVGTVIGAAAAISFIRQQRPVETVSEQPSSPAAKQDTTVVYTAVPVESLPGWQEESIAQALPALHRSCEKMKTLAADRVIGIGNIARPASAWHTACDALLRVTGGDAALRAVLTSEFVAYRVASGSGEAVNDRGLFTGYYEAELRGSFEQNGTYQYPIYGLPRDLVTVDMRDFAAAANLPADVPASIVGRVVDSGRGMRMMPYFTRAEIDGARAIANAADVLVWVDDPVAAHILHIQGSGRVTLPDGSVIRIGFAGSNGRAFKGIGSILLEAGALKPGGASMIAVRDWLRAHSDEAASYMNRNARYIFFRKLNPAEAQDGPIGSAGVSLTPGRSLAVDPRYIPLGTPLWLETKDPDEIPIQRLVVAQDTGTAITGPIRGDFFWGHGEEAFMKAARMKSSGGYVIFVPKAPESLSSPVAPPVEPTEPAEPDGAAAQAPS